VHESDNKTNLISLQFFLDLSRHTDRQKDRTTGRQKNRQTDRKTERQTVKITERQTDRPLF
jgi:hypothetical protein